MIEDEIDDDWDEELYNEAKAEEAAQRAEEEYYEEVATLQHRTIEQVTAPIPYGLQPKVRNLGNIESLPNPKELVEGLIILGGTTGLIAASNVGKGFFALGLAFAVQQGIPFMGRKTLRGSTLYIGYEHENIRVRSEAHALYHQLPLSHVYHASGQIPLNSMSGSKMFWETLKETEELIKAEKGIPLRMIIIDTFRAALEGDENTSEDVQGWTKAVTSILAKREDLAVLVTHHEGKDSTKGARGSSAFTAAIDSSISLKVHAGRILVWETTKVRDAEKQGKNYCELKTVTLPTLDQWGKPRTSLVLVEVEEEGKDEVEQLLALTMTDDQVFNLINGERTVEELQGVTHIAKPRLNQSLARLARDGRIIRHGPKAPWVQSAT